MGRLLLSSVLLCGLWAQPAAALDSVTIHVGLKTTLRHTYKNSAGTAQSIAGFEIHGSLRRVRGGETVLTISTEGDSPAIEIIESGSSNVGVFDVTISGAATAALAPGYYLLGYTFREEGEEESTFFGEVGIDLVKPIDSGPSSSSSSSAAP